MDGHVSYQVEEYKRCWSCVADTRWRVRAGTSVYPVCRACMGTTERACADNQYHMFCNTTQE